ncbi:MAG: hypothetical protein ACOY4M_10205 [Pseudomonadota bacterium]
MKEGVRAVEGNLDSKRVTMQVEGPALGRERFCAALTAIRHHCAEV